MKTPHKWAKEIKAWADGETIQTLTNFCEWIDLVEPRFDLDSYLRIKPEPIFKNHYLHLYLSDDSVHFSSSSPSCVPCTQANIKLIFTDGKLTAAEVLK